MRKHFLAFKGIARRLRVVGLLAFLFSFTFPTPAQGTIHFSNRSVTPSIAAPVIDSRTGQRLEGTAWTAALYYTRSVVSDPTLLIAAQPATHFLTGVAAGYIRPVDIELTDVGPKVNISVQMRTWNTEAGNTYEEAARNPIGVVGQSNLFTTTTGGGTELAGDLVGLTGFSVFAVPEPSSTVLILSGLAALSLCRSRKRSRIQYAHWPEWNYSCSRLHTQNTPGLLH
jgi:hypothetical protein